MSSNTGQEGSQHSPAERAKRSTEATLKGLSLESLRQILSLSERTGDKGSMKVGRQINGLCTNSLCFSVTGITLQVFSREMLISYNIATMFSHRSPYTSIAFDFLKLTGQL